MLPIILFAGLVGSGKITALNQMVRGRAGTPDPLIAGEVSEGERRPQSHTRGNQGSAASESGRAGASGLQSVGAQSEGRGNRGEGAA